MTVKTIVKEGAALLIEDIRRQKWAMLAIAAYFVMMKQFTYSLCPMVTVTGFPCPACGLSRAGFSLLKGKFLLAFEIHPFIYPIVFLVFLFILFRYVLRRDMKILKIYLIILMASMIVYYVYRMICFFPGEPPISYYRHNCIQGILDLIRSK